MTPDIWELGRKAYTNAYNYQENCQDAHQGRPGSLRTGTKQAAEWRTEPLPAMERIYAEAYETYRALYPALKPIISRPL